MNAEKLPTVFFPILGEEEAEAHLRPDLEVIARMLRCSVDELLAEEAEDDIPWSWPL